MGFCRNTSVAREEWKREKSYCSVVYSTVLLTEDREWTRFDERRKRDAWCQTALFDQRTRDSSHSSSWRTEERVKTSGVCPAFRDSFPSSVSSVFVKMNVRKRLNHRKNWLPTDFFTLLTSRHVSWTERFQVLALVTVSQLPLAWNSCQELELLSLALLSRKRKSVTGRWRIDTARETFYSLFSKAIT